MRDNPGMMWAIVTVAVILAVLVILTIYYAVTQRREKPVSGRHGLVGEIGEATTDLNPEGRVLVHGEWWNARAAEHIPAGTKVKVVATDKMILKVERAPEDAS